MNTQASQGPTEETAQQVDPAIEAQRAEQANAAAPAELTGSALDHAISQGYRGRNGEFQIDNKTEHKGVRNPDVERSPQAGSLRRRGYENDVDVTAQGTGRIISLPVYGKLFQLPKTVSDLDYAWVSLFNEHENGTKLVADLRSLVIPESELDILMYEARQRGDAEARHAPLYLVVAYDKKDAKYPDAVPVAQYLVSTKLISDGLIKSPSPVMATSIYKFGQNEDVSAKYSLQEGEPAQGPTEEVAAPQATAAEDSNLPGWVTKACFLELLRERFWFHHDQYDKIIRRLDEARRAGLEHPWVKMTQDNVNNGRYTVSVSPTADDTRTLLMFVIQTAGLERDKLHVEEVNEVQLDQVAHRENGNQPQVRRIVTPTGWLTLAELAQRWKTIFNEDMFGEVVVGRLGDLEKRQGPLSIRIIPAMPHEYLIMVYRAADLPSFVYAGDQVIMKNGHEVVSLETIHLQATIVEGDEVVSRLKVPDEFVSPRFAPKQSAEQIAAESRKAAVVGLHPTDLRTFDAIAFQQFVDQVQRANLAIGDAARLVAFMEFIAKCQQIEKTLFFHCTAYGLQLETMIAAGKRHFPGAAEPAAGSLFSSPPRWGGRTQAQQNPTTQSYVQPNQTASDVVISVYGAAGPLLGVFQCAVPPVGYTVG